MPELKTMDDVLLDGKRVLVRCDFNVAAGEDGVVDSSEDYRIEAAIATIEELMQRRCKVLLLTHRGRPAVESGDFSLEPARRRLEELLKVDVLQFDNLYGDEVEARVGGMEQGSVAMLPNVRLDDRERAGSEKFANELAASADAYINEAFSVSHRDHTSVALLPKLLPAGAGRRCVEEFKVLSKLAEEPNLPYVAVVSGNKVRTKAALLRNLLHHVDTLCLGGVIANTFLVALRHCSLDTCPTEDLAVAEKLWEEFSDKIVLPEDVLVGPAAGGEVKTVSVTEIPDDVGGVWDLGPQTVKKYLGICAHAKTVMWNGPLGMIEQAEYSAGTNSFAEGLSLQPAYRVVGGGNTVQALEKIKLADKYDHVSVGGGAMLQLLEGGSLPGLEPLYK